MKKKVFIAVLLLLIVCSLCGCNAVTRTTGALGPGRFVTMEQYVSPSISGKNDYRILVDRDTKVQYLYHREGLTVILNPDGSPQIYQGELE